MDDVDRLFQCFKCGVSLPSTLSTSLCIDRYDRFMVCLVAEKMWKQGKEKSEL